MAAWRIFSISCSSRGRGAIKLQSQYKWKRKMSSADSMYHEMEKIISASISAVSPLELVSKAVAFDTDTNILTVADHKYPIDK